MVVSTESVNILEGIRSRVQQQGDIVRSLKDKNAAESEIKLALDELRCMRKLLEEKEQEIMPSCALFDRSKLEDLLKQRFFYDQSFAIYGGIQGLYDYGPMGCAMKANLLAAWRQHFVLEDQLLEVDCSILTPHPVLQASGHVDRFSDLMVKDVKTGECFRADHLVSTVLQAKQKQKQLSETEKKEIDEILSQLENFNKDELEATIRRFGIKSPVTENDVSEPQEFNLMFATSIGPTGQCRGFLRPETAQGIFVNFQRLLQFNQGRIPFGAAQIGSAFRNEISPRSGLIRVREFTMAEIEYFVDPTDKRHPKFDLVKDVLMNFYSACDQLDGLACRRLSIGEAVEQGIVANETLGYFMARIHLFLLHVGVDEKRLRFRQHLSNEMAHYACDCWDAECQTSYGWIECVGCADRSCYDLTQHSKVTGTRLMAEKRLEEPRLVRVCQCIPNKQSLGKVFRGDSKAIATHLTSLSLEDASALKQKLASNGEAFITINDKTFKIDTSMVHFKDGETKVHVDEFVPNVIEPSFGIGRILYTVFEHSFKVREGDEQRTYLSVSPILAPFKCSILPLSTHPDFQPFVQQLSRALTQRGVTHRVDESSGSIGRRYARTDQIAIPYGITIDFDTVNISPASATLRERDSMQQIRVPLDELPSLISDLSNCVIDWLEAQTKYPAFVQQETAVADTTAKIMQKPSTMKSESANLPIIDTTDSMGVADEWQSVSEDLEDSNRKLEFEIDHWSSATETPDTNTINVELGESQMFDLVEVEQLTDAIDSSKSRMDIFNDKCNDVVRGGENVEGSPNSGDIQAEWDSVRLCLSAINTDQEDNVTTESRAKSNDLIHDFDTCKPVSDIQHHNVDSVNEISVKMESSDILNEKQIISSATSSLAYHGLFVGDGWPVEKSVKQKHTKSQENLPEKKSSKPNKKESHVNTENFASTKTQDDGQSKATEWSSVIAKIAEDPCVPELSQFQMNTDLLQGALLSTEKQTDDGLLKVGLEVPLMNVHAEEWKSDFENKALDVLNPHNLLERSDDNNQTQDWHSSIPKSEETIKPKHDIDDFEAERNDSVAELPTEPENETNMADECESAIMSPLVRLPDESICRGYSSSTSEEPVTIITEQENQFAANSSQQPKLRCLTSSDRLTDLRGTYEFRNENLAVQQEHSVQHDTPYSHTSLTRNNLQLPQNLGIETAFACPFANDKLSNTTSELSPKETLSHDMNDPTSTVGNDDDNIQQNIALAELCETSVSDRVHGDQITFLEHVIEQPVSHTLSSLTDSLNKQIIVGPKVMFQEDIAQHQQTEDGTSNTPLKDTTTSVGVTEGITTSGTSMKRTKSKRRKPKKKK